MTETLPALGAAFLTGLLGSAHCLGMCAGISGLFAVRAEAVSLRRNMPLALTYNAGRVLSYSILGLVVAAIGSGIVAATPASAGPVRLISGAVIVLIGLQVAFDLRYLRPIERMGALLWSKISPAAKNLIPVTNAPRALGLGLLWGLLPCGLVYSVLLIAAASSVPANGALIMLAFGLGTAPAMLMTGLGAARLTQFMTRRSARLGLGLLIVLLGLLTLAMPASKLLSLRA